MLRCPSCSRARMRVGSGSGSTNGVNGDSSGDTVTTPGTSNVMATRAGHRRSSSQPPGPGPSREAYAASEGPQFVYGGDVLLGVLPAGGGEELEHSVEHGHPGVPAQGHLVDELEILQREAHGKASRILMAPHLAQLLEPVGGTEGSLVQQ